MRAFLGLGSNKGDRIGFLRNACKLINEIESTEIVHYSSVYETEPWGIREQEMFLNAVVEIETSVKPEDLIKELKVIEKKLERSKTDKWAEREIDIDVLFYADYVINTDSLKIPHAEIENRNFVLVPMIQLHSQFEHPVLEKTIYELYKISPDPLKVNKTDFELF